MNKQSSLYLFLSAVFFMYINVAFAESDDDFKMERDKHIVEMQEKISCLKGTQNWEEWEECHQQAERNEKRQRIEDLKEEQRRLEEELEHD